MSMTIAAVKFELRRAREYPEDWDAPIRDLDYSHVHVAVDVLAEGDGIVTLVADNAGRGDPSTGIELDITAADARKLARVLLAAADASGPARP